MTVRLKSLTRKKWQTTPHVDTRYSQHGAIKLLRCIDMDELEQLRQRVAELEMERDEADRRAGAAERGYASYLDAAVARDSWLKKAKAQWGADSNISFDVVWAEALAQKEQITTLKSERDELNESVECLSATNDFLTGKREENIVLKAAVKQLKADRDAALAENAAYYQLAKKEVWEAADKEITTLKSALREAGADFKSIRRWNSPPDFNGRKIDRIIDKAIATITAALPEFIAEDLRRSP